MGVGLVGWLALQVGSGAGVLLPHRSPRFAWAVILLLCGLPPAYVVLDSYILELSRRPGMAGTDDPTRFFEKGGIFLILWCFLWFFGGWMLPKERRLLNDLVRVLALLVTLVLTVAYIAYVFRWVANTGLPWKI